MEWKGLQKTDFISFSYNFFVFYFFLLFLMEGGVEIINKKTYCYTLELHSKYCKPPWQRGWKLRSNIIQQKQINFNLHANLINQKAQNNVCCHYFNVVFCNGEQRGGRVLLIRLWIPPVTLKWTFFKVKSILAPAGVFHLKSLLLVHISYYWFYCKLRTSTRNRHYCMLQTGVL